MCKVVLLRKAGTDDPLVLDVLDDSKDVDLHAIPQSWHKLPVPLLVPQLLASIHLRGTKDVVVEDWHVALAAREDLLIDKHLHCCECAAAEDLEDEQRMGMRLGLALVSTLFVSCQYCRSFLLSIVMSPTKLLHN
jgi:hypothetical protein